MALVIIDQKAEVTSYTASVQLYTVEIHCMSVLEMTRSRNVFTARQNASAFLSFISKTCSHLFGTSYRGIQRYIHIGILFHFLILCKFRRSSSQV